jgi:hypothetical protein
LDLSGEWWERGWGESTEHAAGGFVEVDVEVLVPEEDHAVVEEGLPKA